MEKEVTDDLYVDEVRQSVVSPLCRACRQNMQYMHLDRSGFGAQTARPKCIYCVFCLKACRRIKALMSISVSNTRTRRTRYNHAANSAVLTFDTNYGSFL